MSVTKQDLHHEQAAHNATRAELEQANAARIAADAVSADLRREIAGLRDELAATRREAAKAVVESQKEADAGKAALLIELRQERNAHAKTMNAQDAAKAEADAQAARALSAAKRETAAIRKKLDAANQRLANMGGAQV